MSKYSCEKCAKFFSQKSHYDKHLTRKNSCEIPTDKINALIDKAVDKKWIELKKKLISNNNNSNMTDNPNTSKMSKLELLEKCKELGITKCSSKNKSQLIELINSKQKLKAEAETEPKSETDDKMENTTTTTPYSFIEVCAGGGGLSAGLIKAGFTPILLNDNNSDCCKTLKHNHPEANVVCGSMEKIDYSQYVNKVDLLTGGVPCQSFSQAGLRKGLADPRGDLMMKFVEILNLVKPKIFMIENVKGLLTHDDGKTIEKIIDTLNKNNLYNISYKCLDASKYDVPQKRERVFIIGVLKSITHSF